MKYRTEVNTKVSCFFFRVNSFHHEKVIGNSNKFIINMNNKTNDMLIMNGTQAFDGIQKFKIL